MLSKGTSRRVTLAEIARVASVSQSTVSTVLNDTSNAVPISQATRQLVLETAKRLGYRPNAAARALATGRSYTILMVVAGATDIHLVDRLRGAEAYLATRGYPLHVCMVDAEVGLETFTEIIRSGRADGVLLTGLATPDTHALLKKLKSEADEFGKPVVAIANAFPEGSVDMVADVDDLSGAEQAVAHLIGHGHRRIAFIGVQDQPWVDLRLRGYELAHENAGIPVDQDLVSLIKLDDDMQPQAYEATTRLLQTQDFTALFALNDMMAVAAMAALRVAGKRVPEDCAVVGYDDDRIVSRYTDPPLTTVRNPFYDQGTTAGELLVNTIEGRGRHVQPVLLPVSLVVRQSCGCT